MGKVEMRSRGGAEHHPERDRRQLQASRDLASGLPHAIFAGRLMVFEATVYPRSEHLAVLAAVDMRLTGHLFLWVINVECVLVREKTFKPGRVEGFIHFQGPQ